MEKAKVKRRVDYDDETLEKMKRYYTFVVEKMSY